MTSRNQEKEEAQQCLCHCSTDQEGAALVAAFGISSSRTYPLFRWSQFLTDLL